MAFSPLVNQLIEALRILPGVGPKSAQRMAFNLLSSKRDAGQDLALILQKALSRVGYCSSCRVFCETTLCDICSHKNRDEGIICIVESPANVAAIEAAGGYNGLYFVLSGLLSPIDGVGPDDIGLPELQSRLNDGKIHEVILAVSATAEGEATAYFVADMVKDKAIPVTRIAQGVPMGGDLEYIDGGTIARALQDRSTL